MKRIYLAGPEVFLPDAEALGHRKKQLCRDYGFTGLFPIDSEIRMADDQENPGFAISRGNENLIREADIIIANLTPFRGPSADVGTVYELGLARGLNKLLAGYSNCPESYLERVWQQSGEGELAQQPCGDIRDRSGLKIEEFGLHDNLMIEGGIHNAGGLFLTHAAASGQRYSDLTAFEALLAELQRRFS